jgi:hypothetical protein
MISATPTPSEIRRATIETHRRRKARAKELGSIINWPSGTPADVQRVGLALQRIRAEAAVIFQMLQGTAHHRRGQIQAHADHIRGLSTRAIVSLTELPPIFHLQIKAK